MSDYYIDRSQTAVEAQKRGAPSSDKVWTLQEYEMFYRYLSVLPQDIDYPVLSSEKSAKLFRSLIDSVENVLNEPAEDGVVFIKIIKLKSVCQKILELYVDKGIKIEKYNSEVAYLYGIQIQILSQMQKIADRIVKTSQNEGTNSPVQAKGLELMKQGAAVQVSVCLDLLSESDAFKDNATLLLYFKQYVPELLRSFDRQRKDIVKKRIIEVSVSVETPSTKQVLNDIASGL
jgi:hypothetical protein